MKWLRTHCPEFGSKLAILLNSHLAFHFHGPGLLTSVSGENWNDENLCEASAERPVSGNTALSDGISRESCDRLSASQRITEVGRVAPSGAGNTFLQDTLHSFLKKKKIQGTKE